MKWEILSENIKRARKSNTEHLLPFDDFYNKIEASQKLFDFVNKKYTPRGVLLEAQKHIIVMCVSAMGSFFQGTAQIYIECDWFEQSFLDILKQEKISLAELIEINEEQMTIGEIISVSQSFQNLNTINHFFSKMLNIKDFIRDVSICKVLDLKEKPCSLIERYPKYRNDIDELVRLRHEIIHHKFTKESVSEIRLNEMVRSLMNFVIVSEVYLNKYIKA